MQHRYLVSEIIQYNISPTGMEPNGRTEDPITIVCTLCKTAILLQTSWKAVMDL